MNGISQKVTSSLQNNSTVLLFHAAITTSTSRAWLHKARLHYFSVLYLCSGNITINISWLNKRNLFLQASQNGSKTFWIVTLLFVFFFLFLFTHLVSYTFLLTFCFFLGGPSCSAAAKASLLVFHVKIVFSCRDKSSSCFYTIVFIQENVVI